MTIHIDYDRASRDLAGIISRVADDREIDMIDRPGAEGVALVAADELTGLLETAHLLRSPENARRLLTALEQARGQIIPTQSVDDLRKEVGLGEKKRG